MPGFVTDYGTCLLDRPIFVTKVIRERETVCDTYEEDKACFEELEKRIRELEEVCNETIP